MWGGRGFRFFDWARFFGHRLVVNLYAEAQAAGRHDVLSGQDADGNLSLFRQVDVVLQFRTATVSRPFLHHVGGAHAAIAAPKTPQYFPSVKAGVYLPLGVDKVDGADGVFLRGSGKRVEQRIVHLVAEAHGVAVLVGDAPLGVADVVVEHHAVPLPTSQHLIIIVRQPLVFRHEVIDGEAIAHRGGIVYHRYACRGHSGVIDQLVESILG